MSLTVKCIICRIWVECIGCEEWFHMHCNSIPLRQHARLEQVDFVCHLCHSETLLYQVSYLVPWQTPIHALWMIFRLLHIILHCQPPFSVLVRKLPLATRNTLHTKVPNLLVFLCSDKTKRLIHLVLQTVRVCPPLRKVSITPKSLLVRKLAMS